MADEEFLPLAHRDDLSPELLEEIQKKFPGMKIVCTGDAPGGRESLPPEILAAMMKVEEQYLDSFVNGTCVDCGKVMFETWPPEGDDWNLPEGWVYLSSGEDVVVFICPDCNKEGPEFVDLSTL